MDESLWWTYGVVRMPASVPPDLRGLEGHRVELVQQDSLAALTSAVPAAEFSGPALERRLNDLETIGPMARAHELVLERALAEGDVIPFPMCTLYVTKDALRDMLLEELERLVRALDRIHGAVELGVKAFAAASSASEQPRPASGTEYLKARLAERSQAAVSEASLERSAAELHARLTDHSAGARLLRPQDRRLSGREQEMLLNGAYLVQRADVDAFAQLVEAHAGRGELMLDITGPWPPYHFAEAHA
jgi:hypothetical protein